MAGRPVLVQREVEVRSEAGVAIYDSTGKIILVPNSSLVLTNFRLISINNKSATQLNLEAIHSVEDLATIFRSSKRFRLRVSNGDAAELKFLEGRN
jgi:hypothetical protein